MYSAVSFRKFPQQRERLIRTVIVGQNKLKPVLPLKLVCLSAHGIVERKYVRLFVEHGDDDGDQRLGR